MSLCLKGSDCTAVSASQPTQSIEHFTNGETHNAPPSMATKFTPKPAHFAEHPKGSTNGTTYPVPRSLFREIR